MNIKYLKHSFLLMLAFVMWVHPVSGTVPHQNQHLGPQSLLKQPLNVQAGASFDFSSWMNSSILSAPHLSHLLLVLLFCAGCSSMTPQEEVADLTFQIRNRIKAGESGNSYGIVELIDERREALEESELSREDLAGGDGLNLKGLAREIFLEFGIVVEGARERDMVHIQDLLRILPPDHIEGFHSFVLSVNYNRFYDHNAGGRYYYFDEGIVSFSDQLLDVGRGSVTTEPLAHEIGHFYHIERLGILDSLCWWWMHLVRSGDEEDYPSEYAQTNHWEDYAVYYEGWVTDTIDCIKETRQRVLSPLPESEVRIDKLLMVARTFVIRRNNQLYIRVYEHMNYRDVWLPIEDPDDLELFHLYSLRSFARDEMPDDGTGGIITYYDHPHQFVDTILSEEGYNEEVVARRLYRMIQQILSDSDLNEEQKRVRIIRMIYRFLNADPTRSARALSVFQRLRLREGGTLVPFNPDHINFIDELEAMWFLEPVAVERWLFEDLINAMQKIRALVPYFEDVDSPRSWPVLLLAIHDRIMLPNATDPQRLYEILSRYCQNQPLFGGHLSSLFKLESTLIFRFLRNWNADYLRLYLAPEFSQQIRSAAEATFRTEQESGDYSEEELTWRYLAIISNRLRPINFLSDGNFASVEIVRLFSEDIDTAIQLIFGRARPQNREDLVLVIQRTQSWQYHWNHINFQPVLEELRRRFRGVEIKEMFEQVISDWSFVSEDLLLGTFVLLVDDLENFIRDHGRFYMDYGEEPPNNSNDFTGRMSSAARTLRVRAKLMTLFEVSPQAFEILYPQLTEEEKTILIRDLFEKESDSWTTERDVFERDSLTEVRILDTIMRLESGSWFPELIETIFTGTLANDRIFNRAFVFLSSQMSDELRSLLSTYLLTERTYTNIFLMQRENGVRNRIIRMMRVLENELVLQRLNQVLPLLRRSLQPFLQEIIEEIETGQFEFNAPGLLPVENNSLYRDDSDARRWERLRERWEEELREAQEEAEETSGSTSHLPQPPVVPAPIDPLNLPGLVAVKCSA